MRHPLAYGALALGLGTLIVSVTRGSSARARCGIYGPIAPKAVRERVLDAWEAKGYDRAEAARTMTRESGFRPHALACGRKTGRPIAGGMIQAIDGTLRRYGFRGGPAAFAALSAEGQLPVTLAIVRGLPRGARPGDSRLVLFLPSFVRASDSTVVADIDSPIWCANPSLREPGDGPITAGSVRRTVL